MPPGLPLAPALRPPPFREPFDPPAELVPFARECREECRPTVEVQPLQTGPGRLLGVERRERDSEPGAPAVDAVNTRANRGGRTRSGSLG